jgi:RNA polymerase sigma-70 factor (family 1)
MPDGVSELEFKKIYLELYPKLLVFARAFLHSKEEAEDIADDVMIKLWNNRNNISAIRNLKFYLFVATKNACLNYISKHNKNPIDSIDDYQVDILGVSSSPEDKLISDERLSIIHAAINALPPKCKLIFLLIKEDGLKYSEAAELLNVSVKTIETQMSLAFKKISQSIGLLLPEVGHLIKSRFKS